MPEIETEDRGGFGRSGVQPLVETVDRVDDFHDPPQETRLHVLPEKVSRPTTFVTQETGLPNRYGRATGYVFSGSESTLEDVVQPVPNAAVSD